MFRKSPLNYVGGKHRLLSQLKTLFPVHIETFVDLFCGGMSVSMNVEAKQYIANDILAPLIDLYRYLQVNDKEEILSLVDKILSDYQICQTNENGYLSLREHYNRNHEPLKLMVLIGNSFNHQLRFNSNGSFNMPFGRHKCHWNSNTQKNLIDLIDFLHTTKIELLNKDFREIEQCLNGNECFLYCDPPYQNTTAVYNANWTNKDEQDLLDLLDSINKNKGHFALSCVPVYNGLHNNTLEKWSKKYIIHNLNWVYTNCNYHKRSSSHGTEVCITNY
jgi:DNA adenine methylase Dam